MRNTQVQNMPTRTRVMLVEVPGVELAEPTLGSVHKVKGQQRNRYQVVVGTQPMTELSPDRKVKWEEAEDLCDNGHDAENRRQRPGGIVYCPTCYRRQQRRYRRRKRGGVDGRQVWAEKREAMKAERLARLEERKASEGWDLWIGGWTTALARDPDTITKGGTRKEREAKALAMNVIKIHRQAPEQGYDVQATLEALGLTEYEGPTTWADYRAMYQAPAVSRAA